MEQSPSWEANRFSASQEIPCILWNPKVHYRIHKSLPPFRLLSQRISLSPRQLWTFLNKGSVYGDKLLAPSPTPKLEDHAVSAVRNSLFNIFSVTLHLEAVPPSATWWRAMLWCKLIFDTYTKICLGTPNLVKIGQQYRELYVNRSIYLYCFPYNGDITPSIRVRILRRIWVGLENRLISLSLCPSVRMYQQGSHWNNFCEISYWGIFTKICPEAPSLVTVGQK